MVFSGTRSKVFSITLAAAMATIILVVPASAQPAPSSSGWQPGPGAAGDPVYQGFIDLPSNGTGEPANSSFVIGGWFADTTAQGWAGADDMQVFAGTMGSGGTMLAKGIVGQSRPDVGAFFNYPYWSASGFSASVPTSSLPAGNDTLNVYIHTPSKGWWFKQVTVNVGGAAPAAAPAPSGGAPAPAPAPAVSGTNPNAPGPVVAITSPTNGQNVLTNTNFTITGTANDPTAGAKAIDKVELWIDGRRGDPGTRFVGNADLDGGGGWSLTFSPTKFPSINSNLYAYAHSTFTGKETVANVNFNIQDKS